MAAIGLYIVHAIYYGTWIIDDAAISFTYARNLSEGYGLVLNPGGERVEGYSNPLWVFVLSLFFRAGLFDPVFTPKLTGILSTLVVFFLIFRISQHIFGSEKSIIHLMPLFLIAANVSFVVWSISGLENGIYVLCIFSAAYFYLKESDNNGRYPLSGILFFMTAIVRPEGILFFVAALFHKLLSMALKKEAKVNDFIWAGSFVIPFLLYHLWHYWYFAGFFPNTYYAKLSAGSFVSRIWDFILNTHSRGWVYVRGAFSKYHLLIGLLPALLIVIVYFRRSLQSLSLPLLFLLASLFYPVYVGGDWMMQYRFLSPFFPLAYLFICGACIVIMRLPASSSFAPFIILTVTLLLIYPNIVYAGKARRNLTVPFSHIVEYGERFKGYAEKAFIRDASLLHPDLGGTSFVSGLRMIDLAGLADVHIARYHWNPVYFRDYIFREQKPTFIHTHCYWSAVTRVNLYPEIRRDYIPIWEKECDYPRYKGIIDGDYVRKDLFVVSNPAFNDQGRIAEFNGDLELSKYETDTGVTAPGNKIHMTVYWKSLRPADMEYRFSLALIDNQGQIIFNQEYPFAYGWYPVNRWIGGEVIREEHDIPVPMDAADGYYDIVVTVTGGKASYSRRIGQIEINMEKTHQEAEKYHAAYEDEVEKGDYERALQSIKKAIILQPENESYVAEFGSVRLRFAEDSVKKARKLFEHEEVEEAANLLLEAKRADKFNKDVLCALSEIGDYYYRKGKNYSRIRDNRNAFYAFEMALKLDPSNSWARKRMEDMRAIYHSKMTHGNNKKNSE
jgi:tetratricopeptide (TPR) repeat protein